MNTKMKFWWYGCDTYEQAKRDNKILYSIPIDVMDNGFSRWIVDELAKDFNILATEIKTDVRWMVI